MALLCLLPLWGGCYLDHGQSRPLDPETEMPPFNPCGCSADEVCIRACWGETMCAPRPAGPANPNGCYGDDPCVDVGVCFGADREGVIDCACVGGPPPPPPGTPCGAEVCGADEVCVEHCAALVPSCQPARRTACRDDCDCFDRDPCAVEGPQSFCTGVNDQGHVTCGCDAPLPTCEEALEEPGPTRCDEATFGTCEKPLEGIDCCWVTASCENGDVNRDIFCDDSCAQSCEYIERPADCRAFGCEWFDSQGACVEETERVRAATGCIPRRGASCDPEDETSCAAGEVCTGFAFDPCAGAECDACGAIQWQCTRPLLAP